MNFSNVSISDLIQIGSILIGLGVIYGEIKNLSKRVEKHNQVIERVFKIEANLGEYDIGAMNQRISSCEQNITRLDAKESNNVCLTNHQTS